MNPRVEEISVSLIRQVAAKKRPTSIDLGMGEPSLRPTQRHLDAGAAYIAQHGLRYSPNAGEPRLREAIARHYNYPQMGEAANVCVTVGSQEAMYAIFKALFDPARDELLIVEPTFPSYVKMARLEGIGLQIVRTRDEDDFGFDVEAIVDALTDRTRAILLCSPCNPTGRAMTREQGLQLAAALAQRPGEPIWVIHDEIYREQVFIDDAVDFARIYPHTIVANSISKSNALTGLRLGWTIAPERFIEQAIKAHAYMTSCADAFAQAVAYSIFTTPDAIAEHRAWYAQRRSGVLQALDASGLRALPIDGSFYACVQLAPGTDSLDAAMRLIERDDVLTIPGIAFGPNFESWLRLSWVAPLDRFQEGLHRIAALQSR
ncbi:MAG TPA: pyridoxal phosphate-dependent aminotransferase [Candidatus Baltobacteraceae bacterium]